MKTPVPKISEEIPHFRGCYEISGERGEINLIFQIYLANAMISLINNTFVIIDK